MNHFFTVSDLNKFSPQIMVLHFPNKLTEEEEALQLKYAKLRRKKKQLHEVNKPKQEPEQNKLKRPQQALGLRT